MSAKVLLFKLL